MKTASSIAAQAEAAFLKTPNTAMLVHGVRKIHQGTRGRRTALFPSRKNGITVALESQLEADYCLVLERDPSVQGYRCQAIEITHNLGSYVPDFLIKTANSHWEVHEVKPSRLHLGAQVIATMTNVSLLLKKDDIVFRIVDQTDIPSGIYKENLYFLYQASYAFSLSDLGHELARKAAGRRALPLSELHARLNKAGLAQRTAEYMLFRGDWHADLSRPLTTQSMVEVTP